MDNSFKPLARKENLVVQELDGEFLIYDLNTNKAHSLNESASIIWNSCNGARTIDELKIVFQNKLFISVNDEFIWLALDQLKSLDLIDSKSLVVENHPSRRELLRKAGLVAVGSLPVVATLAFPRVAMATTCASSVCGVQGSCLSGEVCCPAPAGPPTCQSVVCSPACP